ncbi:hypothetical protein [Ligilactobacillus sp. LYQ60]|uniref:hypothetical protein n=1 Tax=unclassified Ligilactobacillus TaxID=2767920 RepID=UPI003854A45B
MAYRPAPFITPFAVLSAVLALGATNVVVNRATGTVEGKPRQEQVSSTPAPVKSEKPATTPSHDKAQEDRSQASNQQQENNNQQVNNQQANNQQDDNQQSNTGGQGDTGKNEQGGGRTYHMNTNDEQNDTNGAQQPAQQGNQQGATNQQAGN